MFKTEDIEINGAPRVSIILDAYPDVSFVLDYAKILEIDGYAKLSYNYNIVSGTPSDTKQFEHAIGDFIVWYIDNKNDEMPLIFKGGT